MGTMKQLAANSFWRDGFKDQLTVAYRDQLYNSVKADNDRFNKTSNFLDEQIARQLETFGKEK